MVQVTSTSVFANALIGPLAGIADLDLALFGDQWRLFATSKVESNISVFDVLGDEAPGTAAQTVAVTGGQFAATSLDIVSVDTGTYAVFSGDGNAVHDAFEITTTGSIGESIELAPASNLTSALAAIASAQISGGGVVATTQEGQNGFTVQSVDEDLALSLIQTISVGVGDVSDIEMVRVGETNLTIALDRTGTEILSYTMAEDGTLALADSLGVMDGLGLIGPDILKIVNIDGISYGIVAASSSSSISIFEISESGDLTARDHVIDGQGTRFASISELEIVEANGRAFVMAAGADDGLTLLELMPDGRLIHHATIEDSAEVTLQNVSGLTGQVQGNTLHVFAASETEAGITELTIDLGMPGLVDGGTSANDTLNGGAGDDVLFGGHGSSHDILYGNDGDDILVAGQGTDTLNGGAGADTFVFGDAQDGGRIEDFNVAEDTLDLSGWFLLQDVAQLGYVSYGNRVNISFRGYSLTVTSHDGSTLDPADLAARITINPSHSILTSTPEAGDLGGEHFGTAGDDVLFGSAGDDVFYAQTGRDVFVGGDAFDIVSYEDAATRVKADLQVTRKSGGEAKNDKFFSIEGVEGTDFRDVLVGDEGDNWFEGGADRDKLNGRSGNDELQGGAGNDLLKGSDGEDTLNGGEGNDKLRGGADNDTIIGGAGNDNLGGGLGADTFYFNAGRDKIVDFSTSEDLLFIDSALLADPNMTVDQILETYGQDLGRSVRLNFGEDAFGDDQMVTLNGVRDMGMLSDSLFVY